MEHRQRKGRENDTQQAHEKNEPFKWFKTIFGVSNALNVFEQLERFEPDPIRSRRL
jgi:hypothetical protein